MGLETEVIKLKILRTTFQDMPSRDNRNEIRPKLMLVLDMEEQAELTSTDIPDLANKMEHALPGIFPDPNSRLVHACGGRGTEFEEHPFRDEVEAGTNIPHLYEHVLLHLLSRRSYACSAYCGQRSADINNGITSHYYLVLDYPSKLEAIVAVDIGFQLVSAWIEGRVVRLSSDQVLSGIRNKIEPMVCPVPPSFAG